jgi:hypothetical protein
VDRGSYLHHVDEGGVALVEVTDDEPKVGQDGRLQEDERARGEGAADLRQGGVGGIRRVAGGREELLPAVQG